ncbi:hypothetical protein JCM1840_006299 [Sporobolomyces johnsonii]
MSTLSLDTSAAATMDRSSSSSSTLSSSQASPTLSLSRVAFVSSAELEAALEREREMPPVAKVSSVESSANDRKGWDGAVGPKSGRKIGQALQNFKARSNNSLRRIPPEARQALLLADDATSYNRTPPISRPLKLGSHRLSWLLRK